MYFKLRRGIFTPPPLFDILFIVVFNFIFVWATKSRSITAARLPTYPENCSKPAYTYFSIPPCRLFRPNIFLEIEEDMQNSNHWHGTHKSRRKLNRIMKYASCPWRTTKFSQIRSSSSHVSADRKSQVSGSVSDQKNLGGN